MCIYANMCACLCMCLGLCASQKSTLGVLQETSSLLSETVSHWVLGLADFARMDSHQAPRGPSFLYWVCRCSHMPWLSMGAGDLTVVLQQDGEACHDWTIPLTLYSLFYSFILCAFPLGYVIRVGIFFCHFNCYITNNDLNTASSQWGKKCVSNKRMSKSWFQNRPSERDLYRYLCHVVTVSSDKWGRPQSSDVTICDSRFLKAFPDFSLLCIVFSFQHLL